MKYGKIFLVFTLIFLLGSCGEDASVNNFVARQDNYLVSEDKQVIIEYKTDTEGKLIELNIDRLLTIEQMILLNPIIDFEYELEGFTGDIFMSPRNACTDYSNDLLIPINIEVGNTRYRFSNSQCTYKTVDNYNDFKPGYSDEYLLTDTIPVSKNVKISIIVYVPDELVKFVEIYEIPNSYERLGVYNIMFNQDNTGFRFDLVNYYRDMSIYEQIYIKHQENAGAVDEVMGVSSEINLMDINSLTEAITLIDDFENTYELEIQAIVELQETIGLTSETDDEDTPDDEDDSPTEDS
jgi:hypothetical protein